MDPEGQLINWKFLELIVVVYLRVRAWSTGSLTITVYQLQVYSSWKRPWPSLRPYVNGASNIIHLRLVDNFFNANKPFNGIVFFYNFSQGVAKQSVVQSSEAKYLKIAISCSNQKEVVFGWRTTFV